MTTATVMPREEAREAQMEEVCSCECACQPHVLVCSYCVRYHTVRLFPRDGVPSTHLAGEGVLQEIEQLLTTISVVVIPRRPRMMSHGGKWRPVRARGYVVFRDTPNTARNPGKEIAKNQESMRCCRVLSRNASTARHRKSVGRV